MCSSDPVLQFSHAEVLMWFRNQWDFFYATYKHELNFIHVEESSAIVQSAILDKLCYSVQYYSTGCEERRHPESHVWVILVQPVQILTYFRENSGEPWGNPHIYGHRLHTVTRVQDWTDPGSVMWQCYPPYHWVLTKLFKISLPEVWSLLHQCSRWRNVKLLQPNWVSFEQSVPYKIKKQINSTYYADCPPLKTNCSF